MLLHEFYPDDIRLNKETAALLNAGFEVHLICLQRKGELSTETINGIYLHRLAFAQSFFWRGIWDILLVAFGFFQPQFYKKLYWLHQKENFDFVHVHDLPLAKTAIKLKRQDQNVKIVMDFHENYPEALRVWFSWKANPFIRIKNNLFFGFKKWLKYEGTVCQFFDHIIVVVEEMKERLNKVHNTPLEKMTVVTNSETTDFLNQQRFEDVYTKQEGDFILAYTGNVGPHRGVDTVIKGMAHLKHRPNIRLELTGKLSADTEKWLQSLIKEQGVQTQVQINGYQPFNKFFSYMALADVNLIPHNRNGHTDHTIPHKLFQGMMVGKPVVVSDAPPLKRIIEALNTGLVFEAENDKDFAEKILRLADDKVLYSTLGANGYTKTVEQNINWEYDSRALVNLYTQL